jgi:hypothetical protein
LIQDKMEHMTMVKSVRAFMLEKSLVHHSFCKLGLS